MTEDDAKAYLATRRPDAMPTLERYVDILVAAAVTQNLVSKTTLPQVWSRHIADSAQLAEWMHTDGPDLDIGSGAGLPGIVLAAVRRKPITLAEPRKLRVDFLKQAVSTLGLPHVTVHSGTVQTVIGSYRNITARAVAGVEDLQTWTKQVVSRGTRFILPRGQSFDVNQPLTGINIRVEESISDPQARILIFEAGGK